MPVSLLAWPQQAGASITSTMATEVLALTSRFPADFSVKLVRLAELTEQK
jgi:hypothetical protein